VKVTKTVEDERPFLRSCKYLYHCFLSSGEKSLDHTLAFHLLQDQMPSKGCGTMSTEVRYIEHSINVKHHGEVPDI